MYVRERSLFKKFLSHAVLLFIFLNFSAAFTHLVTRNVVPDTSDVTGEVVPDISDISLCIPSMLVDYERGELIQAALSIREQSLQPREVIISMSEVPVGREAEIEAKITQVIRPVNVRFLFSSDAHSPGENRNIAVDIAQGSVISFFDADDVMHPLRIKLLQQAFDTNPDLRLVLHGLTSPGARRRGTTIKSVRKMHSESICAMEQETRQRNQPWLSSPELQFELTHGHLTVRSAVAKRMRFQNTTSGEDCHYIRVLLHQLCNASSVKHSLILDFPLTEYVPRTRRGKVQ